MISVFFFFFLVLRRSNSLRWTEEKAVCHKNPCLWRVCGGLPFVSEIAQQQASIRLSVSHQKVIWFISCVVEDDLVRIWKGVYGQTVTIHQGETPTSVNLGQRINKMKMINLRILIKQNQTLRHHRQCFQDPESNTHWNFWISKICPEW